MPRLDKTDVQRVPSLRYQKTSELGQGGFGTVFDGVDTETGQRVAIKEKNTKNTTSKGGRFFTAEEMEAMFGNEAKILWHLSSHPRVVNIFACDGDKIIMERLSGSTLSEQVDGRPMALDDALYVTNELLRGVADLHNAEVVHRDLSPRNVYLHYPAEKKPIGSSLFVGAAIRFIDFGNSTLKGESHTATTGRAARSGVFGAPEDKPGKAGDLYQVGVLAIFMLRGQPPSGNDPCPGAWSRALGELRHVPRQIRKVLKTAIHEDPGSRYQSAEEFLAALQHAATGGRLARLAGHAKWLGVFIAAYAIAKSLDSCEAGPREVPRAVAAAVPESSTSGSISSVKVSDEGRPAIEGCSKITDPAVIHSWEAARDHMVKNDPRSALVEINSVLRQKFRLREIDECPEFFLLRAQILVEMADAQDASDEKILGYLRDAENDLGRASELKDIRVHKMRLEVKQKLAEVHERQRPPSSIQAPPTVQLVPEETSPPLIVERPNVNKIKGPAGGRSGPVPTPTKTEEKAEEKKGEKRISNP